MDRLIEKHIYAISGNQKLLLKALFAEIDLCITSSTCFTVTCKRAGEILNMCYHFMGVKSFWILTIIFLSNPLVLRPLKIWSKKILQKEFIEMRFVLWLEFLFGFFHFNFMDPFKKFCICDAANFKKQNRKWLPACSLSVLTGSTTKIIPSLGRDDTVILWKNPNYRHRS